MAPQVHSTQHCRTRTCLEPAVSGTHSSSKRAVRLPTVLPWSRQPIDQRRDPKTKKDQFNLQAPGGGDQGTVVGLLRAARCAHKLAQLDPARFSILNDTFDDDQARSSADYIEYSIQSFFMWVFVCARAAREPAALYMMPAGKPPPQGGCIVHSLPLID